MLHGKKILIGITGSIAAYKIILLTRMLLKAGAEVKIIMTPSAKDFVSPLTLSTLSKNEVLSDLFDEKSWANHVMLGRWADVMLIAPLSCNTLAKMAHGFCDNLLMAVYLSATCKVLVAPAMDEDMWKHASTNNNLKQLQSFGVNILPVERGELASGLTGEGRMADPETIFNYLNNFFNTDNTFKGKKILITAGPTYEAIDPVRFVGNHSSGKMGLALANIFKQRGGDVFLVIGPSALEVPDAIHTIRVQSADEMYDACMNLYKQTDIIIMAAAVADYTPVKKSHQKIKKKDNTLTIELKKTKDILGSIGKQKKSNQILVGFALETNNEKENALNKLKEKNCDLIVLNSLNDAGAGFGHETNKITVFDRSEKQYNFDLKSKQQVALDIAELIKKQLHE